MRKGEAVERKSKPKNRRRHRVYASEAHALPKR